MRLGVRLSCCTCGTCTSTPLEHSWCARRGLTLLATLDAGLVVQRQNNSQPSEALLVASAVLTPAQKEAGTDAIASLSTILIMLLQLVTLHDPLNCLERERGEERVSTSRERFDKRRATSLVITYIAAESNLEKKRRAHGGDTCAIFHVRLSNNTFRSRARLQNARDAKARTPVALSQYLYSTANNRNRIICTRSVNVTYARLHVGDFRVHKQAFINVGETLQRGSRRSRKAWRVR